MTILEMKDKKGLLLEEVRTMTGEVQKEMRQLNEDEDSKVKDKLAEIGNLNKEIREAEEANAKEILENKEVVKMTTKERKMSKFSLSQAIRQTIEGGRYTDEVMQVLERGRENLSESNNPLGGHFALPFNYRAAGQEASTDAGGGYTVATEQWDLLTPLSNQLVTVQAGAQLHTDVRGDVAINQMTAPTVGWQVETGSAAGTDSTFSQTTYSPKRMTCYVDISRQLINQSSFAVDQIIQQELLKQVAVKLEGALFAEANVTNAANSIMTTLSSISGSVSYANMVALETGLANANNLMGNIKYITNAAGYGKLKGSVKVSSTDSVMLAQDGMVNGYDVKVTNSIPSTFGAANNEAGIILADWSDLHLFNWGGAADITVDTVTRAIYGQVRLVVNSYWDAGFFRSTSKQVGSFGL